MSENFDFCGMLLQTKEMLGMNSTLFLAITITNDRRPVSVSGSCFATAGSITAKL
jgi:hypothetical protein